MKQILSEIVELVTLEQLEVNLFRGNSRDVGQPMVYGGQVLGQALSAAAATVDGDYADRRIHSLHAYFLRAGDIHAPIVYKVDRSRDGGSFSARRVVAIQHGRPIFTMGSSFQEVQEGVEHQTPMPQVPDPDSLPEVHPRDAETLRSVPEKVRRWLTRERPFEFRTTRQVDPLHPEPASARQTFWFRAVDSLPDTRAIHRHLLCYVSDYNFLTTSLLPHGVSFIDKTVKMASLDHAMWFHREFRIDEWLLYVVESPSACGGRGLVRGEIFTRDGRLVASTAQEGMIRVGDDGASSE